MVVLTTMNELKIEEILRLNQLLLTYIKKIHQKLILNRKITN
jgi:hypothetical protein